MPIYEQERLDRAALDRLRRRSVCCVCNGRLAIFHDLQRHKDFLACWEYLRTHHEGIARPASEYEQKGLLALNIETRRQIMLETLGAEKTRALEKYQGVLTLTKPQAAEIMESLWPKAPEAEKARAVLLCVTQQLNPLMKHVFLIPFNEGTPKEKWETVLGIKAKRLMASRRGTFSYVDDTPRVMTEEEQVRRFGEVDKGRLSVIVKLKDPKTGAEVVGIGQWVKGAAVFGADKGNSPFNMATIHAESQALDRLRPGDMPQGFTVMDEAVAEEASRTGITVESTARAADAPPLPPASAPTAPNGGTDPDWDELGEPQEVKADRARVREFADTLYKKHRWSKQRVMEEVVKTVGREVPKLVDIPADSVKKVASHLADLVSMA